MIGLISLITVAASLATKVHAQGLALGLILGLAIGGSGGGQGGTSELKQLGLSAIPLRCLTVDSEIDYADCRWTSMMAELQAARNNRYTDSAIPFCSALLGSLEQWRGTALYKDAILQARSCDVKWHIDLEIKALRALNNSLSTTKPSSDSK